MKRKNFNTKKDNMQDKNALKKRAVAKKVLLCIMIFWTVCSILACVAFARTFTRSSGFNVINTSADSRSVPASSNDSVVLEFTNTQIFNTSYNEIGSISVTPAQLQTAKSVQILMPFLTFNIAFSYDITFDSTNTNALFVYAYTNSNGIVNDIVFGPNLVRFSSVYVTNSTNADIIYDYIDNFNLDNIGNWFYSISFYIPSVGYVRYQSSGTFREDFSYRVLEFDNNGSYQEGYDDGYASGEQSGYQDGYASGVQSGYQDGYSTGLDVSSAGFFYDSSLQLNLRNVDYGNNVYQDIPYTDLFGALTPSKYVFGGIDFSEFDYIYDYVTSVTGQLNADWVATDYILTFRNPVPVADLLLFATGVTSSFMSPVTLTAVDGTLLSGRFDVNNGVNGGYPFVFNNTNSLLIDSLSWSGSGGFGSFNFAFSVQNYGYNQGYQNGYDKGSTDTIDQNRDKWIAEGYENGYNVGRNDGLAVAERSNFYSLITSAIDVPINAVLDALNFEILGVDMKGFFTGLLTLCVIIWIIRLVL